MLVRTIRKHANTHGDTYEKNYGKQYEVEDQAAKNLIAAGLVEQVKPAKPGSKED